MGWLFGRKKIVPKVPFPQGRPIDDKALQFPAYDSSERVIEPEKVKEAVGFSKPMAFPDEEETMPMDEEELPAPRNFPLYSTPRPVQRPVPMTSMDSVLKQELYVKVEVYQRMLGELDELRRSFTNLQIIHKSIDESEYNEENNFNKLRRGMKSLHDGLLQADKILFKSQGD